jgi:hypothetical protein
VVDRATFNADLDALRTREKAHTYEGDAIAAARRRLPMVEVDGMTPLIGPNGQIRLLDAFDGRRVTVDMITAGAYGPVVRQTGDPLGPNPGPTDCCFPPPPGSPPEMGYSGSRERSGCAHQSGNLVGVFTFVQLPRGCPRPGIEHLETLGSIVWLSF